MPGLGELDLTKKPQKIELFLAKPDKTIIAKLNDANKESLQLLLGGVNQLSFDLPYEVERQHVLTRNPHVDMLKDRYLIKAKVGSNSDWYIINANSDAGEDNGDSKKIKAMLLAYELKDKLIRLYSTEEIGPKTCTQVLTDALSGTVWTIGTIAASFDAVKRSFDVQSKTVLDFVIEIAETFTGLIVWDTENRKISIVEQDSVGTNKGLRFSYGKYLKTLNKDVTTDEMTTRLIVYGKDDISINRLNPTGSDYLENFGYFLYPFQQDINGNVIKSSDYMSDGLCKAILIYNSLVASKDSEFKNLVSQKSDKRQEYSTQEIVVTNRQFEKAQVEDIKDIQQANGTYNSVDYNYTGITSTHKFTLKGLISGRKHAVMMKIANSSGITVSYKLGNGSPVNKVISSNTWTILSKENVVNDTEVLITVTGVTVTNLKIVSVQIYEYEFAGSIYEGAIIKSDGANNSVLTTTDPETSWKNIQIGNKVYVENGTTNGYDETEMVGTVTAVDISDNKNHKITINSKLNSGTYNLGYRITTITNNYTAIINNYCLDYVTTQHTNAQSALSAIGVAIDGIDIQIASLRNILDVENNFTVDQLKERNMFIIEKEWIDQNYIDDQTLYDDAKKKFEKLRQPQTVIDINIVNLLEVIELQRDWDKLVLGDIVTIVYEKFNTHVEAKIIEINFDYDNGDVSLRIANMKEIETDKDKLIKLLYQSMSTSTTVDMNKFKWNKTSAELGEIGAIINGKWDAVTREITAGVNESVVINARGITIQDPNDSLKFLRATHGILGITNDGGNSFKHAITSDGIVAERLYGQVIMGNALTIGDVDGLFTLYGNTAVITDRNNLEVMKFGLYEGEGTGSEKFGLMLQKYSSGSATHKVIMDKDDGFKIQKKVGASWDDIVWLDVNGKLTLKDIVAVGSIATPKLTVANIDINDIATNATGGLVTVNNWIKNNMIQIGTISADKIKTSELIVGTNISMGPSATISWSQVTSAPSFAQMSDINWNNVKSTVVSAGGITTPYLAATAIDGMTITGSTIRTSASGSRVVMDNSGLTFYATNGTTQVIKMNTSDGSATFSGNITSSATITGGTLSGANISGGTINVSTDVTIGDHLYLNKNTYSNGIIWGTSSSKAAELFVDPVAGSFIISNLQNSAGLGTLRLENVFGYYIRIAENGVYAGTQRIDVAPVAVFG